MTNCADADQWLLQKPTDLNLHCLQWQDLSRVIAGPGLTVKASSKFAADDISFFFFFSREKSLPSYGTNFAIYSNGQ